MADNYLITGYHGEPHVTAENDRGIHAGIVGSGRFVLPVGQQFRAEYIGNNTVRMYDGKLMDNGAAAGIPAGQYVDFLIPNTGQGMNRHDLIVFQYQRDVSTGIERGSFELIQGAEVAAESLPLDPTLAQEDLLSGNAVKDQMPLCRVKVSGVNVSEPQPVFELSPTLQAAGTAEHVHGNITNAGKIGSTGGQIIVTGTGGVLEAASPATVRDTMGFAPVATSGNYNDLNGKLTMATTVNANDTTQCVTGKAVADYVAQEIGKIADYEGAKF